MRVRGMGIPIAFGLLGTILSLPVPLMFRYTTVELVGLMGILSGLVTAVSATLVWRLVAGASPTKRRGAVSATLAVVVAALVSAPVVTTIFIVNASIEEGPVILWSVGAFVLVFVLVSLVLSVPAALLGLIAASRPSVSPEADVLPFSTSPDQTYRRLRVFCGLVVCLALLVGAVQYVDPAVGDSDVPEYDPSAPPETQIGQAIAITCSESYVANGTTAVYEKEGDSGASEPAQLDEPASMETQIARNHNEQFVMRTDRFPNGAHRAIMTDEAAYSSKGFSDNPNASQKRLFPHSPMFDSPNDLPCLIEGEQTIPTASVVNESVGRITVTSQRHHVFGPGISGSPFNATFVIDRDSGRIQTINATSDSSREFRTISYQFSYEDPETDRPSLPPRPLRWHVRDLLNGPVFRIPS